jgi:hypothetical protein
VIPFYLNEADHSVDAILLTFYPQLIRVRLRSPSGQIFDQSHPSMRWTFGVRMGFYRFALPLPGVVGRRPRPLGDPVGLEAERWAHLRPSKSQECPGGGRVPQSGPVPGSGACVVGP